MAFSTGYGDTFLQGATGGTVAAGWTIADSGKPDGATVIGAGNIDTTLGPVNNDLGINTLADNVGVRQVGSKVVSNDGTGAITTDRAGVGKAVSAGTLAFVPDPTGTRSETFVIRTVTTKLSDVANTALQVNGTIGDGRYDNTHGIIISSSGNFAAGSFDAMAVPSTNLRPNFTKDDEGDFANGSYTFINPADGTVAVATEIFPTLTLPGELTYHFGGLGKPTTDGYKPKNAFES